MTFTFSFFISAAFYVILIVFWFFPVDRSFCFFSLFLLHFSIFNDISVTFRFFFGSFCYFLVFCFLFLFFFLGSSGLLILTLCLVSWLSLFFSPFLVIFLFFLVFLCFFVFFHDFLLFFLSFFWLVVTSFLVFRAFFICFGLLLFLSLLPVFFWFFSFSGCFVSFSVFLVVLVFCF